jgi:Tfp pilus assembly protein PilF
LLRRAETYNPQDPRIPYFRALWQAQKQGEHHVKAHFLRKALDKDPGFFPARKMLIEQLIDNERYMDAYKLIMKGARHPHQRDRLYYFRNRADWLEQKRASGNGRDTNNNIDGP